MDKLTQEQLKALACAFDNCPKAVYVLKVENTKKPKLNPVYYNNAFKLMFTKYSKTKGNIEKELKHSIYDEQNLINLDKYINASYNNIPETFFTFFGKSNYVCLVTCYKYIEGYCILQIVDQSIKSIMKSYMTGIYDRYSGVYFVDLDNDFYELIYHSKELDVKKDRGRFSIDVIRRYLRSNIEESEFKKVKDFLDIANIKRKLKEKISLELKYKDGKNNYNLITIVPYRNSSNLSKVLISVRRIDDILERELYANKKYYEANIAKSRFLSTVSHDVKTPLQNIDALIKEAKQTKDSQKLNMILDKIARSNRDLSNMIEDIIDMSKIDSSNNIVRFEKGDFKQMCDIIASKMQDYTSDKEITFTYRYNAIYRYCYFDEVKLTRAITNLLINAFKYTKNQSEVKFIVENRFDRFIIEISDEGFGISEQSISTIFDEFKRESKSQSGSGLGLSIVKRYIEANNGTISCLTNPQSGTTFKLSLDLEVVEDETETEIEENLNGLRCLIVEDNIVNQDVIKAMLNILDVSYDVCSSGMECLEKINSNIEYYYDIILLDIVMPYMNGYEVAQRIRSSNRLDKDICIITMSADYDTCDIENASNLGISDMILKPVDLVSLKRVLTKNIKKKT